MTSISSLGAAVTALKTSYDTLDTNKDGTVSAEELAADRTKTAEASTSDDSGTSPTEDFLAKLSAVLLDLQSLAPTPSDEAGTGSAGKTASASAFGPAGETNVSQSRMPPPPPEPPPSSRGDAAVATSTSELASDRIDGILASVMSAYQEA